MSRNKTFLITNACLLPVSYAQRITAAQLAYIKTHVISEDYMPYTSFTVVPYSQAQQRKMKLSPDYSAFRFTSQQ